MNIAICGGDARQLFAGKKLEELGFNVAYTLFDKAAEPKSADAEPTLKSADAILLPLPVCRSEKYVNAPLSDCGMPLSQITETLHSDQTVIGGMFPRVFERALREKNIAVFDHYKDETLAVKNAALTAEGILGILINETPAAVAASRVLITGWGRCAKAAASLLRRTGADISIAARSMQARNEAASMGFDALDTAELGESGLYFDALINTVPALVVTRGALRALKKGCVVVEVASAPFGVDFDAAVELGVRVIKAPSLPGKVAPQTAGESIADYTASKLKGRR